MTTSWSEPMIEPGRGETRARFLYDATNIKLKNVTLSYTLPSGLKPVSDVLKGARIFVSADNLFTWFKDDWKG